MAVTRKTQHGKSPDDIAEKYRQAVLLYATTDEPLKQIAVRCGVNAGALRSYLRRHHRDLVLARYNISAGEEPEAQRSPVNSHPSTDRPAVLIHLRRGQNIATRRKYEAAVEACGNIAYIRYSISRIAAEFKVDGVGLANQLRLHYPEVIERRERELARLGIATRQRGLRADCRERYAAAVELYAGSSLSMSQVAERCDVSLGGLSQHLRFYHKELLARKESERKVPPGQRPPRGASKKDKRHKQY